MASATREAQTGSATHHSRAAASSFAGAIRLRITASSWPCLIIALSNSFASWPCARAGPVVAVDCMGVIPPSAMYSPEEGEDYPNWAGAGVELAPAPTLTCTAWTTGDRPLVRALIRSTVVRDFISRLWAQVRRRCWKTLSPRHVSMFSVDQ